MNIAVDKQPKCTAILTVEIPAEEVASKRSEITSKYSAQAKLPGFRPGKAPAKVIEKKFGKAIEEELTDHLHEAACGKAMEDEQLRVLNFGAPNDVKYADDGTLTYTSTFTLAPEFELPDYKGIEVKSPSPEVTEEELSSQLENLRERLADFDDISDRPLKQDDIAVVDFTTTVDGQALTEVIGEKGQYLAKRENHWLPIKEGSFLPGYAEQLTGMSEGDKKDVKITLDDEFPFEELRGKELTLHTSLEGIKSAKLPELNDEFAEKLAPGKTLDEVKALIRENMGEEKLKQINELKVNQIVGYLNEKISFELPESVIARETQNQINKIVEEGSKQGASDDAIVGQQDKIFEDAKQRATVNLSTNFILQEIAQKEKFSVADSDLLQRISEMASQRKEPIKKVIKALQKGNQIQSIRNSMLIGQTIDFLLDNANVTEVSDEEMKAAPIAK